VLEGTALAWRTTERPHHICLAVRESNSFIMLSAVLAIAASTSLLPMTVTERRFTVRNADLRKASAAIKSVAATCARWGEDEFKVFGVAPMEYSTRNLPNGISLQFYKPGVQPLTEDGCLDLLLLQRAGGDRADVVIKASDGGLSGVRARHLDLIYKLLLDDCRSGALGDDAKLVLGLHPPTASVSKLRRKIAAACLYDKKGQYSRF